MADPGTGGSLTDGDAEDRDRRARHDRQEWVRANFSQIFGTSPRDLQARGIDPRQYAREHRHQIREFAQMQRSRGISVPGGRHSGDRRSGGRTPGDDGPEAGGPADQGSGYGGGRRLGMSVRGGSAWIGILCILLAVRFLLVDSLVGTHAAIVWVLMIGGIMLVARVVLFSGLRKRRSDRRPRGRAPGRAPGNPPGNPPGS